MNNTPDRHQRVDAAEWRSLTRTGEIMGNPAYMSPEACRAGKLDSLSDIYSLGCILFEMLCGHPPFTADPMAMILKHVEEYPAAPAFNWGTERKAESRVFSGIALLCLQKDRNKRPASAERVLQYLRDESDLSSALKNIDNWHDGGDAAASSSRRTKFLLAAGFVVCVGLITGIFYLRNFRSPSPDYEISSSKKAERSELRRLQHNLEKKESLYGKQNIAVAKAVYDLAAFSYGIDDWQNAVSLFERFINLTKAKQEFSGMRADARRMLVNSCNFVHNYDLAEKTLLDAVNESRISDGEQSHQYMDWLLLLGNAHCVNGNMAAAEKAYQGSLKLAEGKYSYDLVFLVKVNTAMAGIFHRSEESSAELFRLQKARAYADAVLSERMVKGAPVGLPDNPGMTACVGVYEELASFYMRKHDYKNAKAIAEKGLLYSKLLDDGEAAVNRKKALAAINAKCESLK